MADGGRPMKLYDLLEIAEALGRNKSSIVRRATRENWSFSEEAVRGGKRRLYAWELLPADVRDALQRAEALRAAAEASPAFRAGAAAARRQVIAESVDAAVRQRAFEQGAVVAAGMTGTRRARMEAKLELLQRLAAFAEARGTGITRAMEDFCVAYNRGELAVPLQVRQHTGADLHPATLRRWKRDLKTKGPAALAGNYGNRAGTGKLDTNPELRDFVVGLLADKPHASAKHVCDALDARFGAAGVDLPDERTVQRWLKKWKSQNAEVFLALTNPDAWKNRYMSAFGSLTEGITRANQLWQLDSSPADLQLVDGRHSLIGVIDLATRRLRLWVSKTSTAESVCRLLRRTILDWGVPEAVKMDNGRDYASQRVGQLLTSLQIEAKFSAPFSPWEKGNIERAFRTFAHGLVELLPGYCGHNVAEAQEIRAREAFADRLFKKSSDLVEVRLTAADLQDVCDRWCNDYYAHQPHEGLGGVTPFERSAQLRDAVRRVADVRALDLLMGAGELRTVTKRGLRIDNLVYIAPELAGVIGEQVLVRRDEEGDLGRVVVYHAERYLCIAECPEVLGVSRREVAIEAKTRQTRAVQDAKAELRAAKRKAKTADIAWDILDRRAEQHAALAALPPPNVVHITPALEAAADAAAALQAEQAPPAAPVPAPSTIADVDDVTHLLRREQAQDETAEQRFAWALSVLMKAPEERNDIERHRLKGYVNSDEFKGRWLVFEYFGPETQGLPSEYAALLPHGTERNRLLQAQQGD